MTCATCTTCELGLDHCHALLVEHDDGTATCLDGCGGPRAVHDDWVPCAELGLGCCEGERPAAAEPVLPHEEPGLAVAA